MAQSGYNEVIYEKRGRTAYITFNRPQARNSLTIPSVMETYECLQRAADDPDLSVVVLRGAGNDFCCGADLKYKPTDPDEPTDPTDPRQYETAYLLHSMRPLTIAAVRGGCAGAGMGWACACDLRVADTTAKFNSAFLDVGLAGDMGLPWSLSRLVGTARAREISFFPGKIDAQTARDMGLITRLFSEEEFEAGLADVVRSLENASPAAVRALKASYVLESSMDFGTFIKMETASHLHIYKSEDRIEAFRAYVEKRPPRYTGR